MKKAFTLIELMIVVAIIAIIAAIAIPNLMESKKSANEGNANTGLKSYCTAQATYQSNNYSMLAANGGTGAADSAKEFADTWQLLGGDAANGCAVNQNGDMVALIPPVFAKADAPGTAWNGYYFIDLALPAANGDPKYNHGLSAVPAQYGSTGVNTYIVNEQAIVYMKDTGDGAGVAADFPTLIGDGTWVNP